MDNYGNFSLDTKTEDLTVLSQRYLAIEEEWIKLNTEMEDLRARIKIAMRADKKRQTELFTLSIYDTHTVKTSLMDLVELLIKEDKQVNVDLTLSKELQKNLGSDFIEKLNVDIESKEIVALIRRKTSK